MTDEPENSSGAEASEVRPLPAPRPGHALQEGEDPRLLPKPREGQVVTRADDGPAETK